MHSVRAVREAVRTVRVAECLTVVVRADTPRPTADQEQHNTSLSST